MTGSRNEPPQDERDVVARLLRVAGPRIPAPDDVARRVRAAVHAEWQGGVRARRTRRRLLFAGLPAAAMLALAAAVTLWPHRDAAPVPDALPPAPVVVALLEARTGSGVGVLDRNSSQWMDLDPGRKVWAGATIRTSADSLAALRMTNGVSLRAGTATELRVLSDSDVFLERGAVYVDNPPSRGPAASVAVRTRFGIVREVGTQFEVRLDEAKLSVRVREGAAVLEQEQRTDTASAGVELRVGAGRAVERRSIPTSGQEWAWVVGVASPMVIEGRPLSDFLTWVTREMGWRLRFADEALAPASSAIVLHGTIAGLTPEEALAPVLATCGLTYTVRDGILTVGERAGEAR